MFILILICISDEGKNYHCNNSNFRAHFIQKDLCQLCIHITAEIFAILMFFLQFTIEIVHSTPTNPQSQGQNKLFNRTFKKIIRMVLGKNNKEWFTRYKEVLY
ncbi:hypothetical protein DMUE_2963 [Dictyocoela muelleri]|nr:hypothetical protein DMUE_2963 [Dictyocoela muelleri]